MKTAPHTVKVLKRYKSVLPPGWVNPTQLCRDLNRGVQYFWSKRPNVHHHDLVFSK